MYVCMYVCIHIYIYTHDSTRSTKLKAGPQRPWREQLFSNFLFKGFF